MTWIAFVLLASSSPAALASWSAPLTTGAYADEISEIQMRHHRRADVDSLGENRLRRIPWADVRTARPLNERLIVDPASRAPVARWIDRLGIVNDHAGERLLRIFFHPEDTYYRNLIVRELIAQGDRIVRWGRTTGYASASRSIFVTLDDQVLMIKMSTNTVNGGYEDKKFSFDDALRSVMNSAALRQGMPGEVMEEPLAVAITPNYGYVVRHYADFDPTDSLLWAPGYAFGINARDNAAFASWSGRDLRTPVIRAWARLTTRANVFFEMANNHLQNLAVGLDRRSGQLRKVMFLDTNDFDQSREDVARGRETLMLDPSAGAGIETVETLRLNTFRGAESMNIPEVSAVRDRHFAEDLRDLPPDRVRRLLSGMTPDRTIALVVCQQNLTETLDL